MKEFARSLAIVIGINNYQNGIDTLQTAVPDANAIAEILDKSYKYKLVHPEFESEVIVNQYATRARLETLFKDILPNKIKPTKSDRLLVYFAGHGIARNSDEGPEGYLIPQDADMKDRDSLLKMREVHDWLAQLECRHLLVILDCCFAGTFRWASYRKLIPIAEEITKAHYDRFIKFPAWQVITSASYNQEALEFLNNRDVEPHRKHSPFAEGLIEALQQEKGDLNNDGVIIATELYLYLRDYVELKAQERQTPGFFPLKKHDRGEYIFKLPNTPLKLKETPKLNKENNPYRGLDPFEEKHAALFFGREEVIKELFTKVSQPNHQLTVVSGISGSGKSSLVQAGLIPCLRKNQARQWLIFDPIRPGTNPYASLARALSQLDSKLAEQSGNSPISGKQLQDKSSQFIQKIQTWSEQNPNSRLLLVIDQLEELITMAVKAEPSSKKQQQSWLAKIRVKLGLSKGEPKQDTSEEESEEWKEFIELLAKILQQCAQLSLVVTLRSDFEPRFQNSPFNSDWANARFIVRPMHSDELREAVEKPAAEKALYFEPPELVDRLVDEVSQMPGALPLLSFTLSEMYIKLYEAWRDEGKEDRALTVAEDFELKGGVAGALTRRANEIYDKLLPDGAHRVTMRRVMLRMVDLEGGEAVRRRVLKPELTYSTDEENERVKTVLKRLVDARLIVTGKEDAESEKTESEKTYYEPAHDFLVRGWERLQLWIGKELNNLVLQKLLTPTATAWDEEKKDKDLWDNNSRLDRLKEIQDRDTADDNWLNAIESEFIARSVKRKKNRQRQTLSIFTGVTLTLTGLTAWALFSLRTSTIDQIRASVQASDARFYSQQGLETLVEAVRAAKTLDRNLLLKFFPPSKDRHLDIQVKKVLYQGYKQTHERNRLQHQDTVRSAQFSPDGQWIVTASGDNTAKLWTREGDLVATLQHQGWVSNAQFSPDGQWIVTASGDNTAKVWTSQGEFVATLEGHQNTVWSAQFSPDGQWIVTASSDNTAKLWTSQGEFVATLPHKTNPVRSAQFSPDGQWIVTASEIDGMAKVWTREGEFIATLQHQNTVWSAQFSPDGQWIVTASSDNTTKLWAREGDLVATLQHQNGVWSAQFSPDGQWIITASEDNTAKLWTSQGEFIATLQHQDGVRSAQFSPDGQWIVTASSDNTTKLWAREGDLVATFQHQDGVRSAQFSPDGQWIITASEDNTAKLWTSQGDLFATLEGHQDTVRSAQFSPDGQLIVTASSDNTAKLWTREGDLVATLPHQSWITSAEFSPDGQSIVTASSEDTAKLLTRKGKFIATLPHQGWVSSAEFSPDGQSIVTASSDNKAKLWTRKGEFVATLPHQDPVSNAEFSPNGKFIVTVSGDKTAKLWTREGEFVTTLPHQDSVWSPQFSQDGQLIVTHSDDNTAKLWNVGYFNLDYMLFHACQEIRNYLKHNADEADRTLCDGIALAEEETELAR